MQHWLRIGLYIAFITLACMFGFKFQRHYTQYMDDQADSNRPDTSETNARSTPQPAALHTDFPTLLKFGGVFMLAAIGAGLLFAHDISVYIAHKAGKALFNEEGEGIRDKEWEIAEQEWAHGNYLEAIRMMREWLAKNPHEQWAALRIAEIYEKDLSNHLAAALEYEEVLKHKLSAERWGWAAIHLANIYSGKLDRTDDAIALLRRIVAEYGQTAAAKKARERLGMVEPESEAAEAGAVPPANPNMPPGFLPRTK